MARTCRCRDRSIAVALVGLLVNCDVFSRLAGKSGCDSAFGDLVLAFEALGIDAEQDLDAVAGPFGDLGCGYSPVEPGRQAGVTKTFPRVTARKSSSFLSAVSRRHRQRTRRAMHSAEPRRRVPATALRKSQEALDPRRAPEPQAGTPRSTRRRLLDRTRCVVAVEWLRGLKRYTARKSLLKRST